MDDESILPDLVTQSPSGKRCVGGWLPPRPTGSAAVGREAHRVVVDKRTHRIRFEDETESSVVIIIDPK